MNEAEIKQFTKDFEMVIGLLTGLEPRMREYLEVVEMADTIGPFLDPTAYRDMLYRKGNMHDMAKLVKLALPLAQSTRELIESVTGEKNGV